MLVGARKWYCTRGCFLLQRLLRPELQKYICDRAGRAFSDGAMTRPFQENACGEFPRPERSEFIMVGNERKSTEKVVVGTIPFV